MAPCFPMPAPLAELCPARCNQFFTPVGVNPQFPTMMDMVASPLFQSAPWAVGPLPWVQQRQQVKEGLAMEKVAESVMQMAPAMSVAKPRRDRVKERQYKEDLFARAAMEHFQSNGTVSVREAARMFNIPTARRTLSDYIKEIKKNINLETTEETTAARLAAAASLQFKIKGNLDIKAHELFTQDERDYFAASLQIWGEMGWPMDYDAIKTMMQKALRKKHKGQAGKEELTVSLSYVGTFVRRRPELRAFKTAHIDPLRAKKATPQVRDCVGRRCEGVGAGRRRSDSETLLTAKPAESERSCDLPYCYLTMSLPDPLQHYPPKCRGNSAQISNPIQMDHFYDLLNSALSRDLKLRTH